MNHDPTRAVMAHTFVRAPAAPFANILTTQVAEEAVALGWMLLAAAVAFAARSRVGRLLHHLFHVPFHSEGVPEETHHLLVLKPSTENIVKEKEEDEEEDEEEEAGRRKRRRRSGRRRGEG